MKAALTELLFLLLQSPLLSRHLFNLRLLRSHTPHPQAAADPAQLVEIIRRRQDLLILSP